MRLLRQGWHVFAEVMAQAMAAVQMFWICVSGYSADAVTAQMNDRHLARLCLMARNSSEKQGVLKCAWADG